MHRKVLYPDQSQDVSEYKQQKIISAQQINPLPFLFLLVIAIWVHWPEIFEMQNADLDLIGKENKKLSPSIDITTQDNPR